jgi:hypothetical protein
MTDTVVPTPAVMDKEVPVIPGEPNKDDFVQKEFPDPDRLLKQAKQLVVDNYNTNRPSNKTATLTIDSVYIVWFSKTLGNWKAIVASPVARGLLWEVTYNGHRGEAYIDVYRKIINVRVPTGGIHA